MEDERVQLLDASSMTQGNSSAGEVNRGRLHFVEHARKSFAFLARFGFREIDAVPTLVQFGNRDLRVDVYHGRRSYEIGFEISQSGGEKFNLTEILSAQKAEEAHSFRLPTASTSEGVVAGLNHPGALAVSYAGPALLGNTSSLTTLAAIKKKRWDDYVAGMEAARVRPKAEEAWRMKDYAKAAELYRQIRASLSPAELQKLAYAEKLSR